MEQIKKTQSFAYFWVNGLYMREIQWGIQALHCAVDMGQIYKDAVRRGSEASNVFNNWANDDKTVILLNAFNVQGLREKFDLLDANGNLARVPWATFSEDEQSLGGVLTCVGVVPNENMMNYMAWAREYHPCDNVDDRRIEWERYPDRSISKAEQVIAEDLMKGRLVS